MICRRFLAFAACLVWLACWAQVNAFPEAQRIVEEVAANHPNLVRLTIHAVPSGGTVNQIVACNIPEKLGKVSDPEDLEAIEKNKTTVLREGNNLDVTVPITDPEGQPVAIGVTLVGLDGSDDQAAVKDAQAIASELQKALEDARHPLW